MTNLLTAIVHLSRGIEHSFGFWIEFVCEAELLLARHHISSSGGCADGDLSLGLQYASLRNESFIEGEYPSNSLGWNAANHELPFDIQQFQQAVQRRLTEHAHSEEAQ